jgi:hypothetical protein
VSTPSAGETGGRSGMPDRELDTDHHNEFNGDDDGGSMCAGFAGA